MKKQKNIIIFENYNNHKKNDKTNNKKIHSRCNVNNIGYLIIKSLSWLLIRIMLISIKLAKVIQYPATSFEHTCTVRSRPYIKIPLSFCGFQNYISREIKTWRLLYI
jgi:hypothetical protein